MNALEKYAAKKKLAGRLGAALGATAGAAALPISPAGSAIGAAIGASKGRRIRSALGGSLGHTVAAGAMHEGVPYGAAMMLPGLGAALLHGGTRASKAIDKAQKALKPIAEGKNIKGLKRLNVKKNRITRAKAQKLSDTLEKIKAQL